MLVKYHLLFSFIFAYILTYFFHFSLLAGVIIFLSSILIDIDHYFYYVVAKKNISLKNAYNWFIKKRKKFLKLSKSQSQKYKGVVMIFHGVESLAVLYILYTILNWSWLIYVLIGFTFHLLIDITEIIITYGNITLKLSPIYVALTNKHKKPF